MPDFNDPLQALLSPVALTATLFPSTSRYSGIETALYERSGIPPVRYLLRRFIPSPDRFALIREHIVVDGDRVDNIASFYFNDPEQFWRIADANYDMRPDGLTERPGIRIRITLPEGVPALASL